MKTPAHALFWELWRTSWTELLLRTGSMCAFVLVITGLRQTRISPPEIQVLTGVLVMMLIAVAVSSQSWILQLDRSQSGFSFRSGFVRPVSTLALVAVPVVFMLASAIVCFVVPAVFFDWLMDTPVPLWGPLPMICCATVAFTAASWSPGTIGGKLTAVISLATGATVLILMAHRGQTEPWLMAMGRPDHFQLAWPCYVLMFATAGVAFVVTVHAVERQRHGDDSWLAGKLQWLLQGLPGRRVARTNVEQESAVATTTLLASGREFRSSVMAQFWYEFRQYGRRTMLIGALAPLAVAVIVGGNALFNPRGEAPVVWLIALVVCPIVFQIIGIDGAVGLRPVRGVLVHPVFDALRPLSSVRLMEIKLIVVAASSLAGWMCMLLACCLYALVTGNFAVWLQAVGTFAGILRDAPWWTWGVLVSSAGLMLIGTTSLLMALWLWMPFHPRIFGSLSATGFVGILLLSWDARHGWTLAPFWMTCAYLVPSVMICGCLFALWRAGQSGMLQTRLFAVAVAVWLMNLAATAIALQTLAPGRQVPLPALALPTAVLLLIAPLTATALAPLALNQHRHG